MRNRLKTDPLAAALLAVAKVRFELFRERFGRDPELNEPLLFDHDQGPAEAKQADPESNWSVPPSFARPTRAQYSACSATIYPLTCDECAAEREATRSRIDTVHCHNDYIAQSMRTESAAQGW
jgi:hypothetical protein